VNKVVYRTGKVDGFHGEHLTVLTREFGAKHHADVQRLWFAGTHITRAEPGWAKHLVDLVNLWIIVNPLDPFNFHPHLEGHEQLTTFFAAWSYVLERVNKMDLTGGNETRGRGMPYMRLLTYSASSVSALDEEFCCETMPTMRHVFFHTNWGVATVPERSFRGNRDMLVVKIQRNIINRVSEDLFKDTTMLFSLDLSDNKIAEIEPNGLPTATRQIVDFSMAANPSQCFHGVNLVSGHSEDVLTCDCVDGYVRGSSGKNTCVLVTCPSTVQVANRNAGEVESDCLNTFVGATCTATCSLSREAAVYTCDTDGIWGGGATTLDCRDVLAPIAVFGLSDLSIEVTVPVSTTNIVWDPARLWSEYEPHYGAEHNQITGSNTPTFDIIVKCVLPPSPDRGTLQKSGTDGTLTVKFESKPGRDEDLCRTDFNNLETGMPGYFNPGKQINRGVVRLFQGNNSTYYDQTVRVIFMLFAVSIFW
jgi:hypothetical protein